MIRKIRQRAGLVGLVVSTWWSRDSSWVVMWDTLCLRPPPPSSLIPPLSRIWTFVSSKQWAPSFRCRCREELPLLCCSMCLWSCLVSTMHRPVLCLGVFTRGGQRKWPKTYPLTVQLFRHYPGETAAYRRHDKPAAPASQSWWSLFGWKMKHLHKLKTLGFLWAAYWDKTLTCIKNLQTRPVCFKLPLDIVSVQLPVDHLSVLSSGDHCVAQVIHPHGSDGTWTKEQH